MRDSWLKVVGAVLRPARPRLEACLRERERHLAARQLVSEARLRALANCQADIERARAEVFAAEDGIVTSRMTDLEREWRLLSRSDPDAGLMDLWARITPASWIDRKRWRDSDRAVQLDAALALAADVNGVETVERAIESLRAAIPIGSRIRWRLLELDSARTSEWLAEPLRAACEAVAARGDGGLEAAVRERAQRLERDVHEAASARLPERPLLARALAHAAFVDYVWRASPLAAAAARPNPVTSLREVWTAGYTLSAIDTSGVTVEIPRL